MATTPLADRPRRPFPAQAAAQPTERPIAIWLFACCAMIFVMVLIGAITRLTESGLSIVRWDPITGALPPLSHAAWEHAFALYQQSPQYRDVNLGMSLTDFKHIFFWEWLHRLWGRLIGLAFAAPLAWFWIRGRIRRHLRLPLLGLFLLGGLQGFIGWFMVESGLEARPSVSQYRLALHLDMAVVLYAAILWAAFTILDPRPASARPGIPAALRRHAMIALAMVAVTMTWGAFTAGLRAGRVYNTFPDMDGHFMPPEMWSMVPVWLNVFANTAAVQFVHRYLALSTAAVVLAYWLRARRLALPPRSALLARAVGAMVVVQVCLGITTLLLHVPIAIAVIHQGGALVLVTLLVWVLFEARGRAGSRPVAGRGSRRVANSG